MADDWEAKSRTAQGHPDTCGDKRDENTSTNLGKAHDRAHVHDTVVEICISLPGARSSSILLSQDDNFPASKGQIGAGMLISTWTLDERRYFTLNFSPKSSAAPLSPRSWSRRPTLGTLSLSPDVKPASPTVPTSCPRRGSMLTSDIHSAIGHLTSISKGSPQIPPHKLVNVQPSLTDHEKLVRMKDVVIESIELPVIAMWKDESVAILNQGIYDLMYTSADQKTTDAFEILSHFKLYTEDFERELDMSEYPIGVLCRTQKPINKMKIGLIDSNYKRRILQISGSCVFDEKTGEYQAGICVITDVTWYTTKIKAQTEQNEQQFQLICEALPQMV